VSFNDGETRFILACKGFRLPEIFWIGNKAAFGTIPSTWPKSIPEKIKKRRVQMYWRTLVADRDSEGHPPPNWYSLAYEDAYKLCLDGELNTTGLLRERKKDEEQISRTLKEFLKRVQDVTWNRRLARLEGDTLALVPERTLCSDGICILSGCDVPVVLRKHRGNLWEFIGEAFVYGSMDGEAMDRPHEEITFNLI